MAFLIGTFYRHIVKPILFLFPADRVHEWALTLGAWSGTVAPLRWLVRVCCAVTDPRLETTVAGITFSNPVGLAAGFDYDGRLIDIIPSVGFGFHTVGTITNQPYAGNPRPMLGRLPRSQALLVNKGFKNAGMEHVLQRVPQCAHGPVGISIGSTNRSYPSFDAVVADITGGFQKAIAHPLFSYFELNISCPNLIHVTSFAERPDTPEGLSRILTALAALPIVCPVFIKMPLERSFEEIDALIAIAEPFAFIRGFVFSNLVKDRSNPHLDHEEVARAGKGNFSGAPTRDGANALIGHVARHYSKRFIIIGCGGIFTAEDAYEKIRLGASLVQLITGMIYFGPQRVGEINQGLARLLARDSYSHISEAVGAAHR
ncbi:MAG: quinone-dependent dihydroorotate dehydrogenase [Patescibacteria group bacterium]